MSVTKAREGAVEPNTVAGGFRKNSQHSQTIRARLRPLANRLKRLTPSRLPAGKAMRAPAEINGSSQVADRIAAADIRNPGPRNGP
jgi:hypothetical protein